MYVPWEAGDKMLFRILQDELGIVLELNKPLCFIMTLIFFSFLYHN